MSDLVWSYSEGSAYGHPKDKVTPTFSLRRRLGKWFAYYGEQGEHPNIEIGQSSSTRAGAMRIAETKYAELSKMPRDRKSVV